MEIAGYPEVVLFVSSSAPDTDFFARLVDEHPPGGPAPEMCYGMVRARHRNSLDVEELLTPGDVVELRIRMGPTACRFEPGHRIRLEITSSDFPNHDRNHNTGKNDLADPELVVATNAVHHSAAIPRGSYCLCPKDNLQEACNRRTRAGVWSWEISEERMPNERSANGKSTRAKPSRCD